MAVQAVNIGIERNSRTLSPIQVGLLMVVGLLAVAVQVLILVAFFNSTDTASDFKNASVSTTNLANIQREVLLLHLETQQFLSDPDTGREQLDLRRAFLSNQLRIQSAQALSNPAIPEGIKSIRVDLNRYNALLTDFDTTSGGERQIVVAQLRDTLSELETQVKRIYDSEELSFFQVISNALRVQRTSQILLLSVSALIITLGVILTLSMRRTVLALRKEMFERLKAEQELQHTHQRLIEAQDQMVRNEKLAAIGQLSGGVAHDLRNPLGAIKNSVFYLRRKLGSSEMARENPKIGEFLQIMDDAIDHSNQIITDLMGFAQINSPNLSRTRISQVIDDALTNMDTKSKFALVTEYDPDLPEILADGAQLQRVFINLAINARDAMTEDGELRIGARQKNEFVEVTFSDNGPGIPQDIIDKIFDPLFTTKTKGTGLGLANCHQIVSRHGGSILVDSQPTKGTTFTVSLPLNGHAPEEPKL